MTETKLLALVRDTLFADSDIENAVGKNIYPIMELNLEVAEFPCIVMQLVPRFYHEPSSKTWFDGLQLFIYSLESKKECYEVHEYVKERLKTQSYFNDANYHLNIYGSGRPSEFTDFHPKKKKNLYYLTIMYKILCSNKN